MPRRARRSTQPLGLPMRVALRISLIYLALVVALGIVGRMDALSFCSGYCQAVAFSSALGYYVLMLPGMKTVGLLVPYNVYEHWAVSLVREGLSLAATAFVVFVVTMLFVRLIASARASRQA